MFHNSQSAEIPIIPGNVIPGHYLLIQRSYIVLDYSRVVIRRLRTKVYSSRIILLIFFISSMIHTLGIGGQRYYECLLAIVDSVLMLCPNGSTRPRSVFNVPWCMTCITVLDRPFDVPLFNESTHYKPNSIKCSATKSASSALSDS